MQFKVVKLYGMPTPLHELQKSIQKIPFGLVWYRERIYALKVSNKALFGRYRLY